MMLSIYICFNQEETPCNIMKQSLGVLIGVACDVIVGL